DAVLLQQLGLYGPGAVLHLRSSHINSPRADRLISAHENAIKYQGAGAQRFDLRQKLVSLDFTHVDMFSLGVVRSQAASPVFKTATNYTDFYGELFKSRLAQVIRTAASNDSIDPGSLVKQLERTACAAAFNSVTTKEPPAFVDIDSLNDAGGTTIRAGVAKWCGVENTKLTKHHIIAAFTAFSTIQMHDRM